MGDRPQFFNYKSIARAEKRKKSGSVPHFFQKACDAVINHGRIDRKIALQLAICPDRKALFAAADEIRRTYKGDHFHLCSIINAKSGNCTENCKFCAQSARHATEIDNYEIIRLDQALAMALENDRYGVHRLSLVTSGRDVGEKTVPKLAELYQLMGQTTSMQFCASMGLLSNGTAGTLKNMGVSRYHCNLEANREYFPKVCTSHSWDEKAETLESARKAGMSLCSGGIIGMGESMEDRIELAFELCELGVKSIPVNILTPIAGTPLEALPTLPLQEVLTTIALFRFINPDAVIRMAGGRQQLGSEQYRCFAAGANGAIVGNFLTTTGSSIAEDKQAAAEMGFSFEAK